MPLLKRIIHLLLCFVFTLSVKAQVENKAIALKEILQSITSISSINQDTASGAEEMAASSESLAELAAKLKSKVDFFNV